MPARLQPRFERPIRGGGKGGKVKNLRFSIEVGAPGRPQGAWKWLQLMWLKFEVFRGPVGVLETLPKGGGRSPPPSGMVSGAPGAAQTPKMTEFQPLKSSKFPPKVQPRILTFFENR